MKFDKNWVEGKLQDPDRLRQLKQSELLDSQPEETFDRATRLAASLLHVPTAMVSLVDDHRQFFKSQVGLEEPWATLRQTRLSHSFCQYSVANGEPLIVEDALLHEVLSKNPSVEALKIRAYAGIPLITADQQVLGVLCVTDSKPHHFTPEDVSVLEELAASVTGEINVRLAKAALARSEARFRALFEFAPLAIFLLRGRTGTIHSANPRACSLLGHEHDELVGRGLNTFTHPQDRDENFLDPLWKSDITALEIEKCYLHKAGHSIWGRLHVSLLHDAVSPDLAMAMVEDVTEEKNASILLQRQADELKALSLTDPLTGLFNRRGFQTLADQMLRAAIRAGDRLVLVFFDLDGLKNVNDQLGHDAGDQYIQEFGHLLQKTFRQADIVARLGGDELVVLAHEAHEAGLDSMLDRFRHNIIARNAEGDLPFRVSASVGHAIYSPEEPKTLDELVREADVAMYEDKRKRTHRPVSGNRPPEV